MHCLFVFVLYFKMCSFLKVQKNENFLAPILKFALFRSCLGINIKVLKKIFLIEPLLGEIRFFRLVFSLV